MTRSFLEGIAPQTAQLTRETVSELRNRQFDRLDGQLDASIDRGSLRGNLEKLGAIIPTGDPISIHTVGAYSECDSRTGCSTRTTLEYEYHGEWMLAELVAAERDGKTTITSLHLRTEQQSMEEANLFTLRGKSVAEFAYLGAWIGLIILVLYSLVLCIRTPLARRKWLWIVFILLGVGKFGLNWVTGELSYKVGWIFLFVVGYERTPFSPWVFYTSLPVGAVVFLIMKGRLKKREVMRPPETGLPVEAGPIVPGAGDLDAG